jgi:hypothetical protein
MPDGEAERTVAHLQWGRATLRWAPDIHPRAAVLTVPAFIDGYPAKILDDALQVELPRLSRIDGEVLESSVTATRYWQDGGTTGADPGRLEIIADSLTERFDAGELQRRVDELADEAKLEGGLAAERDNNRAIAFLEELYQGWKDAQAD